MQIQLSGSTVELKKAHALFKDDGIKINLIEEKYYLSSTDFEGIEDMNELYPIAQKIIEKINLCLFIIEPIHGCLELDGYVYQGEGKPIITTMSATLNGSGTLSEVMTEKDIVAKIGKISSEKEALSHVAHFLSLKCTYANLYKVYEVLTANFADECLIDVSKAELKRFTQSANSQMASGDDARHSNLYDPPKKPMSIQEARIMFAKIIKRILDNENS